MGQRAAVGRRGLGGLAFVFALLGHLAGPTAGSRAGLDGAVAPGVGFRVVFQNGTFEGEVGDRAHGGRPAPAGLVLGLGAPARAEIGGGCAAGERCGAGEVCRAGICMEACAVDASCLEGMYCLDGACVPDAVACLASSHCPPDRVCHEGMCLLPQCDAETPCAAGWVCTGRICHDPNAPDVVPGTDVVSLKRRLRQRYLGCAGSPGSGGALGLALAFLVFLSLRRRRGAGAP